MTEDWADEIADKLLSNFGLAQDPDEKDRFWLTSALRKAKADGLRQAARMQPNGGILGTEVYYVMADKIEKGEGND